MSRVSKFLRIAPLAAMTAAAPADIIYETNDPFGSVFGVFGFDLGLRQSVAVRFTPTRDYTLDRVSVWIMSNEFAGPSNVPIRINIRADETAGGGSIPMNALVFDEMFARTTAIGWNPVLETADSSQHPILRAGVNYWLVLEADVPFGGNPVWVVAANFSGFGANTNGTQTLWQPGGGGGVGACVIEGTPACYADCDISSGPGTLDIFDFLCFQNAFVASENFACACDLSTGPNTCDIFDFLCFQNAFVAGCQ